MPDFFFKDSAGFQQGLFLSFFKEKRLDTLCEKEKPFEKRKKNINARKKNLLRKGSFLLALFLFQTFLHHLFS